MDDVTKAVREAIENEVSAHLTDVSDCGYEHVLDKSAKAAIAAHKQAIKDAGMVIVPRVAHEAQSD